MTERPSFTVNGSGTARWVPNPGDLVTDTSSGRIGKVVAWDGSLGRVTLRPLVGGELWHTAEYRPANNNDRLRARVVVLNREGRGW
ncbi:hypothetical protein I5Q34_16060 [Streptomyces sp. AV19]|nr:hypothetical protein [Streptomyces sp. AV19]